MANLTTIEKQILEKLFQMSDGCVLGFSNRAMGEFFIDSVGVDIYSQKYDYASGSKANRVRRFWFIEDSGLVGKSILKLIEYIEQQIILENLRSACFKEDLINEGKKIGKKLFKEKLVEFQQKLIDMIFEVRVVDINEYKKTYLEERSFIVSNFINAPYFLKQHRTYDSLVTHLISLDRNQDTWKNSARIFINKHFSNFLNSTEESEKNEPLKQELKGIGLTKLKFDESLKNILEQRLLEIKKNLNSDSPLSAMFLIGSTLEGIFFGLANKDIKNFNTALSAPKDKDNKVKKFQKWSLGNYIDVAKEIGYINEDVKQFSHAVRDFRNYIHPCQQINSDFTPSKQTAELCFKALEVAIDQIFKKLT